MQKIRLPGSRQADCVFIGADKLVCCKSAEIFIHANQGCGDQGQQNHADIRKILVKKHTTNHMA